MSNLFKKIKSIETVPAAEADSEPRSSNLSPNLERPILEDPNAQPALRGPSDRDSQSTSFEGADFDADAGFEDDADELLDLYTMPLPGFLKGAQDETTFKSQPSQSVPATSKPLDEPTLKSTSPENDQNFKASLDPSKTVTTPYTAAPLPRYTAKPATREIPQSPKLRFNFILIGLAVFFWIVTSAAVTFGYFDLGLSWKTLTPLALGGVVLVVLAPAILIIILAYTFGQLAKVTETSLRLERAATALLQPDAQVTEKAISLKHAIQAQIDQLDQRLSETLGRMGQIKNDATLQASALQEMVKASEYSSQSVSEQFRADRDEISVATGQLQDKISALTKVVSDQAMTLAKIIQLSDRKVNEARISAEGAAAKMNAASELIRTNTVEATEALTIGHSEIEKLGEMIVERSQELDSVYKNHAKDLTAMIEQLRDEQENLGISLESRLAKMHDVARSAKESAESLTAASDSGRDTIVSLSEASRITENALRVRFTEMEKMVEYSNSRAESINQAAARRVQNSLALTRKEISRIESDMKSLQDRLNHQLESSMVPILPPSTVPAPQSASLIDDEDNTRLTAPESRRHRIRFHPLPDDYIVNEEDFLPETDRLADSPLSDAKSLEDQDPYEGLLIPALREGDEEDQNSQMNETVRVAKDDRNAFNEDENSDAFTNTQALDENSRSEMTRASGLTPVKPKSIWPWRRATSSTKPLDLQTPGADKTPISASQIERQIIATLTGMGLAPGAIVDEGCIIEAANARKSKGEEAMSTAVSNRLREPVNHLRGALELNPELRSDARLFTSQFEFRLNTVANDREAIRTGLESETGRAFLLCDAALNSEG